MMENRPVYCPICGAANPEYEFRISEQRLMRCITCEILFSLPFSRNPNLFSCQDDLISGHSRTHYELNQKKTTTKDFTKLQMSGLISGSRVLIEGPDSAEFFDLAMTKGVDLNITEYRDLKSGELDACVLFDRLGENSDPNEQLSRIHSLLVPEGLLFVTLPILESPEARKHRSNWAEFRKRRFVFFNTNTLAALLVRSGFHNLEIWREPNGVSVLCKKRTPARSEHKPRLSIILPVYNERATFEQLINTVLQKTFEGLEREIVIVESNSTDGSRDLVRQYENYHDIKVIYEDRPKGKGHAVRNGLKHTSGDIVVIQDADLEYDIDDYDALLEPILKYNRLFVLGSRHKGNWKMREFENRRMLSMIFNFGQVFFTWLINVTCNVRLNDPFTMYKVFHRECLYGLYFESNRFDLDWEIVIKFIRKGFVPMEIPVNYVSRSFGEGKKVKPILDPLLWIVALIKYRYGPLYRHNQENNPDSV